MKHTFGIASTSQAQPISQRNKMSTFRVVDEGVKMTPACTIAPEHIMAPKIHEYRQASLCAGEASMSNVSASAALQQVSSMTSSQ